MDSPFVRRFACKACGTEQQYEHVSASRPSFVERTLYCLTCGSDTGHKRLMNGCPGFGFNADGGIPNNASDESELSEWQTAKIATYRDKIHVDNLGEYKGLKHLTGTD